MGISFLGLMIIGLSYMNFDGSSKEDNLKYRGVGFAMLFGGFILAWTFPLGNTQ